MADKLAVIQSDETVKELNLIEKEVEDLIADFKKLYDETLKITQAFGSGKPKDFAKSLEQMESVVKRINAVNEKTIQIGQKVEKVNLEAARARTANAKAIYEEERARQQAIKTQIQEESAKQKYIQTQSAEITLKNKLESLDKKEQARLLAAASLYKKAEEALNSLRLRYNELAIQKQLGVQLNDREEKRMASLEKAMKKYDTALKAVDAAGGKYNRNVGNYASGYNSLGMSVAQVAREMPAFTNSIQTGLMGISNNLPILFDSLRAAKEQNAALRAEGKATIPVWKQLGSALFSWNTALSIGITLLTVYGKDIFEWVKELVKGKEKIDALTLSYKDYNEALKGSDFKKVVRDLSEMRNYIELARQGFMSKNKVLDYYNETLGKVMGSAKSLNEVEAILTKNADNYIKATLYKAAANLALDKAAEEMMKAEQARQKKLKEFENKFEDATISQIRTQEQYELEQKRITNNRKRRQKEEIDQATKTAQAQENIAKNFMKNATKYAKGLNFDFELGKPKKPKEPKKYTGSTLDGFQKDYIMGLEALRDKELAINEKRFTDGEISQKEYLKKVESINVTYFDKKIAYLKGKNAKELAVEAQAELERSKIIKETRSKLYDIESKEQEESFKLQVNSLEKKYRELENNDYITNSERLVEQIKLDGLVIAQTDEFYNKQIELAKNAGESTLQWERKRDEEVGKLQDERAKKLKNQFDAFKKDLDENAAFAESFTGRDYEVERGKILSSNLSIKEKEYRLNLLDLKYHEDVLKIQKNNLQAELIKLKAKKETEGLTTIERNRYAEIERLIANINNQLIDVNRNKEKAGLDNFKDNLNPVKDVVLSGLEGLGLGSIADEFQGLYDTLLDQEATWGDKMKKGFELVASYAGVLIENQKQKRIEALDEELKRSQEATDLEIKFITDRIDWLNNLDTLSKEQISERNRLEDEARTLKEQQLQREKLIAAQKARAEQKAAAEQAFINGLVGAAKSIPNWAQVAASIAAGGLMAALIMSKDPVPQYFVGRERGPAEYAWTQERGREIITDKNDNIKSLGSDKGPQMTWLEAGDKVLTADRTKEVLKRMGSLPKLGEKVFRKAAMQSLTAPVIVNTKTEDNSTKIAEEVGRQLQKAFAKYDKPQIIKEKGKIKKYSGANLPVIIGEYDLKTGEEIWYQ